MSGTRLILPNQQVETETGVPGAGYQLFFYQTGTNTPQNTYQDVGLTTPNTNPIVADARGQFGNVFMLPSPAYRVTLTDASGVEIYTMDPVGPAVGSSGTGSIPVGGLTLWAGIEASIPTGYLICGGQAVSRTTFAALFGVISTTFGPGDGATTFNVPDLRGSVPIGKDDMGGVAANRVTFGGSGINGATLGARGGNQLAQTHNHSITDPGHGHTVTDPTHAHTAQVASAPSGGGSAGLDATSGAPAINHEALIDASATGVTVNTNTTGIVGTGSAFSGSSQNMPPAQVFNYIIRYA